MEKSLEKKVVPESWKAKWFNGLLLVSLPLVPTLPWSAQPVIRIAQAHDALAFLPIYVARANVVSKFFKNTAADVLLDTVEAIEPAVVSNGRLTLDGLKGVEEVYRANGIIKEPVPWDRLVTNEFLPQQ